MTVTIDKADILAALFLFVPGLAASSLMVTIIAGWILGNTLRVGDVLVGVVLLTPLALTSWGLYELAHWFV